MDYRTVLQQEGFLLLHTTGISMEPMLHEGREQSLIVPVEGAVKVNDVVLFSRPNGQFVLHRVVFQKGRDYLIRGDNSFAKERVPRERIIGVLQGYYISDTFVDCRTNSNYLRYVKHLRRSYPLRHGKYLLREKYRALLKKLSPSNHKTS